MAGPNPHDDTSADYEQFEKVQLTQDPDTAGADTADLDDPTARSLVDDLIDADVVTPVPEDRVLVHDPSATTFDSGTQLAVFHSGWTAGRDADVDRERVETARDLLKEVCLFALPSDGAGTDAHADS